MRILNSILFGFLTGKIRLLRENYQDLYQIAEAVKNGQAAKANLLVRNHVYRFNRLMEEKAQQKRGSSVNE